MISFSYPFDWTGLEDFSGYRYDEDGLPQVNYGRSIGWRHNPITIAQFGLAQHARFSRTRDPACRQKALTCCQWLRAHGQRRSDGALVWPYDFSLPFYGLTAPWISAMAQGEAISLLVRCARWENEEEYAAMAHAARRVFDRSVNDGGVVDFLANGMLICEEYPTRPASHVLNGHVFALLGLHDFACFTGAQQDRNLVQAGLQTIVHGWRHWDVGFWTRYDLHPSARLASRMYQEVHVRQMRVLAQLFNEPSLQEVARRWQNMLHHPWCMTRWLIAKVKEKVLR